MSFFLFLPLNDRLEIIFASSPCSIGLEQGDWCFGLDDYNLIYFGSMTKLSQGF